MSYGKYLLHLLRQILYKGSSQNIGKTRQYREVNFEWFGEKGEDKKFDFEEIFDFFKKDYEKINTWEIMKDERKKL